MLIIQNFVFYNLIFFIGRGIFVFFRDFSNKKEIKNFFGINVEYFFPIITFFLIGNISFVANFFIPIKNNVIFIFLLIFILFNFKEKTKDLDIKQLLVTNLVVPLVLGVSSYSVGFHYDAALYHLNIQNWIINEKIVLGVQNIYLPLGYSTLNEYILANFWMGENFIFLHFVNLAFLNAFYSFVYFFIFKSKIKYYKFSGIFLLVYGLLDNFGFNGGNNGFLNIQGIGKVDNNFAIIFFLSSVFLFYLIINKNYEFYNFFIISNLILFAIEMKIYGYGLMIVYIFYFFNFMNKDNLYKDKLKIILLPISLGVLWLVKSYLKTGCLIYPINLSCFTNTPWYSTRTDFLTLETREFHNSYTIGQNIPEWFVRFSSKKIDYSIFLNFFFSYLIILIFLILFFNRKKLENKINYLIVLFIFSNLLIYFFSAPTPRFFIGLFLFIFSISGSFIEELKFNINEKSLSIPLFLLFIGTVVLTPRISDYGIFLDNPIGNRILKPTEIEYITNDGWGVKPVDGEKCWINIECTEASVELDTKIVKGYKIINEK